MAREYDERDARVRPARRSKPRTKDRPSHESAINAFVTTVDRGRTTCVTSDGTEVMAMKARELGPKSVVVGDTIKIVGDVSGHEGSLARIVAVEERRNSLSRTIDDAAKVERTIVANIDQLVVVAAAAQPEPRRGLIDRFLVSAFAEGLDPVLVITKSDQAPAPEFVDSYRALGVTVLFSSKRDGLVDPIALSELHRLLDGKISVLVGHSGVGKSTLINALIPAAAREIGDVNDVTGRGRHTSSSAIAFPLDSSAGGWIIDTPGIRAFGISHISSNEIINSFTDLSLIAATCMTNCSHQGGGCKLDEWAAPGGVAISERVARLTSLRALLQSAL